MLNQKDQFDPLKINIQQAKVENIEFVELGIGNEFTGAHKIKDEICDLLLMNISRLENYTVQVPEQFENEILIVLRESSEKVKNRIAAIKQTAQTRDVNFPANRQGQINAIQKEQRAAIKAISAFDFQFKILDIEEKLRVLDLAAFEKTIDTKLESIKAAESEAKTILTSLKSTSVGVAVDFSENRFRQLFNAHKRLETIWLRISIGGTVLLAVVLGLLLSDLGEIQSEPLKIAQAILRRVIWIIPISLLLRFTLGKFNLERNLRLIYEHRSTVFEQFKAFEAGIGDDKETRGKFLLDLSKNLFADPATGYLQDKSHDVNMNPVVSIVEKVIKPS